ncbi:PAS domain-containing sensor histidine kinase [Muricoccus aerilatus]|uniref:PAS domain-containing sensor histidine kinase n=1 Tax=Muricoccus aerilatus TaxID=452982 RepID=UPI0006940A78|nr:GAF domain-containing protein [Roseomonas aerilata]
MGNYATGNHSWPFQDGEMAGRIRAHDWSAGPLGPIEGWPERLKLMVEFVLASPSVSALVHGEERILIYNDAAARLYGERHPAALGRPLPATFPEGWRVVGPLYARAFAGEVVQVTGQPLDTRGDGSGTDMFDATLIPVRDDAGRIVCVHMAGHEVGAQVRSECRLKRKNMVLDGINRIFQEALIAATEEELGRVCLSVAEEVTGSAFGFMGEINFRTNRLDDLSVSERGWQAFSMEDPAFPRGKAPTGLKLHGIYGRVLLDGKGLIANDPVSHPDRIGTPKGHPPLRSFLGVPLIHAGRTIGMLGLGNREGGYRPEDLEAAEALAPAILQALFSRRIEQRLRESEERLATVFNVLPVGIGVLDSRGDLFLSNQEMRRFLPTGLMPSRDEDRGERWRAYQPDGRRVEPSDFPDSRALRGEHVLPGVEMSYAQDDGREIWTRMAAVPVKDAVGRVSGAVAVITDIDALKRNATMLEQNQERLQVMVAELQHRTRNLLAVVRTIARRSLGPSAGLEKYDARLASLGRVQGFLSRAPAWTVPLADLVGAELAALGAGMLERVTVSGPAIDLPGTQAQLFALALHELATNALKYGALSKAGGKLAVSWHIAREEPGKAPWLHVLWQEAGVAIAGGTGLRPGGFGRELIERALPYQLKARTSYELGADGVRCTIAAPLLGEAGRGPGSAG